MGSREVVRSRAALPGVILAAGGAGLITAGTVVLKVLIWHHSFSTFAIGLLGALNFALSFLLMQVFGFKLATKVSPLIGAALGRQWRGLPRLRKPAEQSELSWSLKTQGLSALGNVAFVIPAALVFHLIYRRATGQPFLDGTTAAATLASFNPFTTQTVIWASFTGVLLWLSTLGAGWLASHIAPMSHKHAKTWTTAFFNILLGAFLAFVPAIGKAYGIALDVRHFTLTGGAIAMAAASTGISAAIHSGLGAALLGLALIGLLNFGVSFALSFISAVVEWA